MWWIQQSEATALYSIVYNMKNSNCERWLSQFTHYKYPSPSLTIPSIFLASKKQKGKSLVTTESSWISSRFLFKCIYRLHKSMLNRSKLWRNKQGVYVSDAYGTTLTEREIESDRHCWAPCHCLSFRETNRGHVGSTLRLMITMICALYLFNFDYWDNISPSNISILLSITLLYDLEN